MTVVAVKLDFPRGLPLTSTGMSEDRLPGCPLEGTLRESQGNVGAVTECAAQDAGVDEPHTRGKKLGTAQWCRTASWAPGFRSVSQKHPEPGSGGMWMGVAGMGGRNSGRRTEDGEGTLKLLCKWGAFMPKDGVSVPPTRCRAEHPTGTCPGGPGGLVLGAPLSAAAPPAGLLPWEFGVASQAPSWPVWFPSLKVLACEQEI